MLAADKCFKKAYSSLLGIRRALLAMLLVAATLCSMAAPAAATGPSGWTLTVTSDTNDATSLFAWQELQLWIGSVNSPQAGTPLDFQLKVDSSLTTFTFAIASQPLGSGKTVTLSGASSAEVLQAAYTALELMGYRFFVSGPVVPANLDLSALPTTKKVYAPNVQRRGIRQHINFPMDVSSYPLIEAREYVHNLARMRYNWITFHSYPGHWTWDRYDNAWVSGVYRTWVDRLFHLSGSALSNGAFFYGDHFPIPNCSLIKKNIRFNQAIYCAPEVESVYYTVQERGQTMTAWLAEVMKECKRAGMHVQFSTEIRLCDDVYNLGLVNRIIADYPLIDALELISREGGTAITGDFNAYITQQKAYMDEILNAADGKTIDAKYRWDPAPLDPQIKDLAYSIRLAKLLTQNGWAAQHKIQLLVGNYTDDPSSVKAVCKLASQYVPANVWYSIMPGHSSRMVADQFAASQIDKALLARTMLYSWIEYDGFMFLQQFAGSGVYKAIGDIQTMLGNNQPVFGMLYNHWRAGENFMSFRYTALASLDQKPTVDAFLTDYATAAGIKNVAKFVSAMKVIDAQSDQRTLPGNIAFCMEGTWIIDTQQRSAASIWWWGKTDIETAMGHYAQVVQDLQSCRLDVTNPQIQKQLELLTNRCQASWCHLKAVRLMQDALIRFNNQTQAMPADLTPSEKAQIASICDAAGVYVRQYFTLTSLYKIDRGVEGLLMNCYYDLPMMVHNFKSFYGGQGQFIQVDALTNTTVPFMLVDKQTDSGVKVDATRYE